MLKETFQYSKENEDALKTLLNGLVWDLCESKPDWNNSYIKYDNSKSEGQVISAEGKTVGGCEWFFDASTGEVTLGAQKMSHGGNVDGKEKYSVRKIPNETFKPYGVFAEDEPDQFGTTSILIHSYATEGEAIDKVAKLKEADMAEPETPELFAEGGMVIDEATDLTQQHLGMLAEYAEAIGGMVSDSTELEAWVIDLLGKAEQSVADVKHYLKNQEPDKFEHGGTVGDGFHVKKQMAHIASYANDMLEALEKGATFEPWMSIRIAIAASNMDSVKHYLDAKLGGMESMEKGGEIDGSKDYFWVASKPDYEVGEKVVVHNKDGIYTKVAKIVNKRIVDGFTEYDIEGGGAYLADEMKPFTDEKQLAIKAADKAQYFQGIDHKYDNPYKLNRAIEELLKQKNMSTSAGDYTTDEKMFIKKYSGMGGLEKFGAEGIGLLYEYFTPDEIVKKMWGLAYKHGYNNGSVIEPSCGTGSFLEYAPKIGNPKVVGYEINPFSAVISKVLYPTFTILQKPFETLFIDSNKSIKARLAKVDKYDLVIGNPPYGDFGGKYAGMGEKDYTKARNYVEYFISRGLDLLNPEGLLIMIIGVEVAAGGKPFLEQGMTPAKAMIAEKSNLLEAYRLPNGVFDRTDVLTDIIVLQKK